MPYTCQAEKEKLLDNLNTATVFKKGIDQAEAAIVAAELRPEGPDFPFPNDAAGANPIVDAVLAKAKAAADKRAKDIADQEAAVKAAADKKAAKKAKDTPTP